MSRGVPHDPRAEEALLGAMLLSPGAVEVGLEACSAEDFYAPALRAVFLAIQEQDAKGAAIDPVTVPGDRKLLMKLAVETPASANAPHYARIIGEKAAARRALVFAEEIRVAALAEDDDALVALARRADEHLTPAVMGVEPALDAADFVEVERLVTGAERSWAIRDVLDRGEVVMLTGGEGTGKTTLMRQFAVQVACGIHPFQRTPEPVRTVLYVDLQDPPRHIAHEFGKFFAGAGRSYERGSGQLVVKSRQQGLDLCRASDARWLDALVAHHQPSVVCLGPLYRAYRGNDQQTKSSEEAAEIVTDVLARLIVRRDCALMLEGHTLHDGEKVDYRPRGSRLWEGWPAFGFGLAPMKRPKKTDEVLGEGKTVTGAPLVPKYRLASWRGPRDRDRPWPEHLLAKGFTAGTWPWDLPDADPARHDTRQSEPF